MTTDPPDKPKSAREAAETAARSYGGLLRAFLIRRLRCHIDAEDVAQTVLVRLLALESVGHIGNLVAYILTVAAREASQHQYDNARDPRLDDLGLDIDQIEDRGPTLEDIVQAKIDIARLDASISPMKGTLRNVIHLNRRGLRNEEIAVTLGLSPHTVKKYLQKIKAALKKDGSALLSHLPSSARANGFAPPLDNNDEKTRPASHDEKPGSSPPTTKDVEP